MKKTGFSSTLYACICCGKNQSGTTSVTADCTRKGLLLAILEFINQSPDHLSPFSINSETNNDALSELIRLEYLTRDGYDGLNISPKWI